MPTVQHKRGLKANLPSSGLLAGELLLTTDQGTAHVATGATSRIPVVPAVDDLAALPSIDGAADLVMIHDASEASGQRAKKVTFNTFKAALNIPPGSSDEKVSAVAGGTSGYLWGTNGTDGVIRMNSSMLMTKDVSNQFVVLHVGAVDCGTF
jgi:hypothetical protein